MTTDNTPVKKEENSNSDTFDKKTVAKKPFWKRHFLSLFLLTLLIVSVAWGYFANRSTVSNYEKQITTLTQKNERELQRIKVEHIKKFSNTFTLSVRSEMIPANMNRLNQYFL